MYLPTFDAINGALSCSYLLLMIIQFLAVKRATHMVANVYNNMNLCLSVPFAVIFVFALISRTIDVSYRLIFFASYSI